MKFGAQEKRILSIATLIALGAYSAPVIGALIKNVMEARLVGTITPLTIFAVVAIILAIMQAKGDF
jgi:hypothetical protein